MKTLIDFYHVPYQNATAHPIMAWDRIMVDEAHDIISKLPMFSFKFLWMISATYASILDKVYGTRQQLSYVVRDLLNTETINLCLVKGQPSFVKQSFDIPEPIESSYLCVMSRELSIIHPFLNASIQERINANDIAGAIREIGGSDSTESNLVAIVTNDIERDIKNTEKEIEDLRPLDIDDESRQARIATVTTELTRLRDKHESLVERVTSLSEKPCPICYDNFNNPIMLPCTHVFCGKCLIDWMHSGKVCPECRAPIQSRQLIAIVDQQSVASTSADACPVPGPRLPKSKEDTVVELVEQNPSGRYLVFSRIDSGFYNLKRKLDAAGILVAEMKGSTSHMMNVLSDFRNGLVKVILLNTYYAGSGIDMNFATDVILFHTMGSERVQAIGRAQRQGRVDRLRIHNLYYANEMSA